MDESNYKLIYNPFKKEAIFECGQVVITNGIEDKILQDESFLKFVNQSLKRHVLGDWGNVPEDDRKANDHALKVGLRLVSSYSYKDQSDIWIISESDRSATTILLPNEY